MAVAGIQHHAQIGQTEIWLIGSEGFDEVLRAGGWRLCKPWFELIAGEAKQLFAILPESNKRDLRWLEWLGFKVAAREKNYRGLGHTCVKVVLDRNTKVLSNQDSAAEILERIQQAPLHTAFQLSSDSGPDRFFNPTQYVTPSRLFEELLETSREHAWEACSHRYVDLRALPDLGEQAVMSADLVPALLTDYVRRTLTKPEQRAEFINLSARRFLSALMHIERATLDASLSLALTLTDPSARRWALMQAGEEARHLDALSRYVVRRWGEPSQIGPGLQQLLLGLVASRSSNQKMIGIHLIIEGFTIGALTSLISTLNCPVACTILSLILADEVLFHQKINGIWLRSVAAHLDDVERNELEVWAAKLLGALNANITLPDRRHGVYEAFGLEPDRVLTELKALLENGSQREYARGMIDVMVYPAKLMMDSGLVGRNTYRFFQQFIGRSDEPNGIVAKSSRFANEGLTHIMEVNRLDDCNATAR